jgi:hypothetical protein
MAEGAFDKDFGYLMPFLDKIAASAATLPDTAAREEMIRLVAGEKQRWLRIRQLLAGAEGKPVDAGSAASTRPAGDSVKPGHNLKTPGAVTETATAMERRFVPQFTVGSLRTRGREN